jgi:hypothetical protein
VLRPWNRRRNQGYQAVRLLRLVPLLDEFSLVTNSDGYKLNALTAGCMTARAELARTYKITCCRPCRVNFFVFWLRRS